MKKCYKIARKRGLDFLNVRLGKRHHALYEIVPIVQYRELSGSQRRARVKVRTRR